MDPKPIDLSSQFLTIGMELTIKMFLRKPDEERTAEVLLNDVVFVLGIQEYPVEDIDVHISAVEPYRASVVLSEKRNPENHREFSSGF